MISTIRPHVVDNLVQIVVNDGNGSQCGKSYKRRLDVARATSNTYKLASWLNMAMTADAWMVRHDGEPANNDELLKAADELAGYYAQHLKEMEG